MKRSTGGLFDRAPQPSRRAPVRCRLPQRDSAVGPGNRRLRLDRQSFVVAAQGLLVAPAFVEAEAEIVQPLEELARLGQRIAESLERVVALPALQENRSDVIPGFGGSVASAGTPLQERKGPVSVAALAGDVSHQLVRLRVRGCRGEYLLKQPLAEEDVSASERAFGQSKPLPDRRIHVGAESIASAACQARRPSAARRRAG